MPTDGVFRNEMPDERPFPIDPLDDDTAERLLSGRLPPEDAPPSYAEVARVLRAAAGPPTPDGLAGQPAALAAFRTARAPAHDPARHRRVGPAGAVRAGGRARPVGAGLTGGRARLVAMALAGALAVGGLWIAAGAQTAPGLRSPTGGPGGGGSGSATSGSLRPAMPAAGPLSTGGPPALPSGRDRATVGNGGDAAHRTHPGHSRTPPNGQPSRPSKPKADKPTPDKPKPPKPQVPTPKDERRKPEKPYRNAAIRVSATQRP